MEVTGVLFSCMRFAPLLASIPLNKSYLYQIVLSSFFTAVEALYQARNIINHKTEKTFSLNNMLCSVSTERIIIQTVHFISPRWLDYSYVRGNNDRQPKGHHCSTWLH